MIAPLQLNFDPQTKNEMFHISYERAREIMDVIDEIIKDVVLNYDDLYSVKGTGEFEGKTRLNEGKVLERFLSVAENQNEWLFILFSANPLFEKCRDLKKMTKIVFKTLFKDLKD